MELFGVILFYCVLIPMPFMALVAIAFLNYWFKSRTRPYLYLGVAQLCKIKSY